MKLIYVISSVLILSACTERTKDCVEEMTRAITSSTQEPETFVVLDVEINGVLKKVCVNNASLQWRVLKKYGIENEKYQDYLLKFIMLKDTLRLSEEDISANNVVTVDRDMESLMREQGIHSLRKKYFNENGVQKNGTVIENQNYLAYLLFENCIVSSIDDETGYMIIKEYK